MEIDTATSCLPLGNLDERFSEALDSCTSTTPNNIEIPLGTLT